ncbi:hypothetical protein F1D05_21380 [Kribbella qitaiheensis]|uniref:Uncharacterized protein n=1 Tax=Kribbella qitaiheensis TaxID=1544730 RepID=A0A7G6X181_9ACTN|nr:hypothetical protein [Kribbella qitaiheensis]QNE19996.1 hypothetical protein F1D05_21380 [Kribbella qitaiheensis]
MTHDFVGPPSRLVATIPRAASSGLLLGLCWGVAARVWMRLISSSPEFSWSGTGFIVGATAIGGLAFGVLYGVRQAGRSRWWRLLGLVWLVVLAGPGIVFLPALLLGGLLYRRPAWARLLGALGIVAAELSLVLVNGEDPVERWRMYGGFLLLSLALAAGSAEFYRPKPKGRQNPKALPSLASA